MNQGFLHWQAWGRELLLVCTVISLGPGCVPPDQVTSGQRQFFELTDPESEPASAKPPLDGPINQHLSVGDPTFRVGMASQVPLKTIDSLVICPVEIQPALAKWIDYRTAQGHGVLVIPPVASAHQLRHQIQQLEIEITAAGGMLKFLCLIGPAGDRMLLGSGAFDANQRARGLGNHGDERWKVQSNFPGSFIPLHYLPAVVNSKFGSEPELATDIPYADLNGDGLPDLSLGRIPFDDPTDVEVYLDRVIRYEMADSEVDSDRHHWRQRINFIAGLGGFGGLVDRLLEQVTKSILTDLIPPEYQTSMTLASWTSPYCPDPRGFCQTTLDRFNEGCLFWVYIGHGAPSRLDQIRLPDGAFPILDIESAARMDAPIGNPIAIFLSCYNGAIDHRQPCLAEVMLRQPEGAIATISGTRVTMPYAMSLLSLELIDEYFSGNSATLGELMKQAKRRLIFNHNRSIANPPFADPLFADTKPESIQSTEIGFIREMIQGVGKVASPVPALLKEECWEHVQMMQLYGDPLLKLNRPEKVLIETTPSVIAGEELTITGIAPFAGQLCIELAYPRDRFRKRLKPRRQYRGNDKDLAEYQRIYTEANDSTWEVCFTSIKEGEFSVCLPIPAEANGACIIRCRLSSQQSFALGATFVEVLPAPLPAQ